VLTDRFVNGDPVQRPARPGVAPHRTFDRRCRAPGGRSDNIGYLGGDFRGLLDNAGLHPRHGLRRGVGHADRRQPDEAFTGGDPVKWGGMFTDRGKTGFHGYWGVNFYSSTNTCRAQDLDFAGLTAA
jgi:cyclomaltodextrin glucanotransferase